MTEPLQVLIVDDEPLARAGLRRIVEGLEGYAVAGECGDGRSALAAIEARRPAVVLLDIEMPELDAFGVLGGVRDEDAPAVVLVTAHADRGLDAFDAGAVDYVLKPVDPERLETALGRATRILGRTTAGGAQPAALDRIVSKIGGVQRVVDVADIQWIEAAGTYVRLHLASGPVLHRTSLARIVEGLDPTRFVRVHRSAVVAVREVRELTPAGHGDAEITLRSGERLSVSRRHRAALTRALGSR